MTIRTPQKTLLPLGNFAKILGIDPLHFRGAYNDTGFATQSCSGVWPEYMWQLDSEVVSRDILRQHIASAEEELYNSLGYWPAPTYAVAEEFIVPTFRNWQGTIDIDLKKLISPGRRATEDIETGVTVVYSDENSDGFDETATITATLPADVTLGSNNEVRVFIPGQTDDEYELRPIRTISVSGSTITITMDAWTLIDPEIYEDVTLDDAFLLDATKTFVTVDVIRVYADTTVDSIELIWRRPYEGHIDETTQGGTFQRVSEDMIRIHPATYDATEDAWSWAKPTFGYPPDRVRVWYLAGDTTGKHDPMPLWWQQAITWMVAARLTNVKCGCTNVNNIVDELQRDMTRRTRDTAYLVRLESDVFANPFGTRVGEYRAWQRVVGYSKTVGGAI